MLVGRFHHRMMELAERVTSIEEVDTHTDFEIGKLQNIVSATPSLRRLGSVSGWDEINVSVKAAIRIVRSTSVHTPPKVTHTETDLHSSDRRLVGRPDYFAIHSDVAELKDYKTGTLRTPEGTLIQRNVDQLRFYSALLFDNFSISSVAGTIIGLNGDRCDLPITSEDASLVGKLARHALADANRMLDRDIFTLAAPSSTACNHCRLQLVCPAFRSAQTDLTFDDSQMLVHGAVVRKRSSPRIGSVEVTLHDTARNAAVTVGMPADLAAHIEVNCSVCVTNLRRHGSSFLWGFESQVYAND